MAVTSIASGAAVSTANNGTTLAPLSPTHQVGDIMILAIGTKPDTAALPSPSGYSMIGTVSGGTGAVGADTGPMTLSVFYRVATGTATTDDTPGTITITGNSVSTAQISAFRVAAGQGFDIVGTGAADVTGGTPFAATMPVNPGLTVGDMLYAVGVIPTDVTTPAQFSAETVSAPGMTTVNLTELNEWDSANGNDMGGWVGFGPVVTGTATGAPTVSATAGGTTTNVVGPIYLVRIREVPPPVAISASDSGTISATESVTDMRDPGVSGATLLSTQTVTAGRNANTLTTSTLTINPGDTIVVKMATEGNTAATQVNSSAGALTFSKRTGASLAANTSNTEIWVAGTGSLGATTSMTISSTWPSAMTFSHAMTVEVWSGATVFSNDIFSTTGNTTGAFNRTAINNNSFYTWIISDWNAANSGKSANLGNTLEQGWGTAGTDYTAYSGYTNVPTTTGAVVAQGIAGGSAGAFSISTLEVLGTATAPTVFYNANDSGSISATESASVAIIGGATPVAASDTGTFSATDASQVIQSNSLSTTDTGTISASESISSAGTMTRTDTGAISATEASSVSSFLSLTDTGTISATDNMVISSVISRADSGTFSATDSLSTSVVISAIDAGVFSATETTSGNMNIALTDTGTFSATEGRTIVGAGSLTELGVVSATDSSYIASVASAGDSGTISATDSSTVVVPYAETVTADTGTVSATESRTLSITMPLTDAGTFSATDTSFVSKTIALTDSGSISATETSGMALAWFVTDTGAISAVDASSMYQTDAKDLTDTGSVFAFESVLINGVATASDSGIFSALDSSTVFKTIAVTDSGTFSATDTSFVFNNRPTTDAGTFSVVDASSVVISGTITKTVADTGTFSGLDVSGTIISALSRPDSGTFSITEERTIASTSARTDTGAISATDASVVQKTFPLSDTGAVSATESVDINKVSGMQVKVWTGSGWISGSLQVWDGTKFVTGTKRVWNGTSWN